MTQPQELYHVPGAPAPESPFPARLEEYGGITYVITNGTGRRPATGLERQLLAMLGGEVGVVVVASQPWGVVVTMEGDWINDPPRLRAVAEGLLARAGE